MSSSNAAVSKSKGKVAPVVLAILDGWGHSEETNHNSIIHNFCDIAQTILASIIKIDDL